MYTIGYLLGRAAFIIGMYEIIKFAYEHWKKWNEKKQQQVKAEQIAREEQAKAAQAKTDVESQFLRDLSDKLDRVLGDQKHDDWQEGYVDDGKGNKKKIFFKDANR